MAVIHKDLYQVLDGAADGIETFEISNDHKWLNVCYEIPNGYEWVWHEILARPTLSKIKFTEEDLLNESKMFFESEKVVALRIEEDYRLELADISDEKMQEVKDYIRAIKPDAVTRSIPMRPDIMNQYSQSNTTLEE